MSDQQADFWSGEFGSEYNKRNAYSEQDWNEFYVNTYGVSRTEMNTRFLANLPKDIKILEVGANIGMQLRGLQSMGFTNLYGVELQWDAVEKSRQMTQGLNIIQGTGSDIPFKDNYFDLVFTSGVLIHIAPENHAAVMAEMVRCSKKYIWGFEYYSPEIVDINYRGNLGFLWKADFSGIFQKNHPELKEIKREYHKYVADDNVDYMYLLEK